MAMIMSPTRTRQTATAGSSTSEEKRVLSTLSINTSENVEKKKKQTDTHANRHMVRHSPVLLYSVLSLILVRADTFFPG